MLSHELLDELHKLSRAEKLRIVQILVNELAVGEETALASTAEYPIYTPLGNEAAAEVLYEFLRASQKAAEE